MRKGDFRHGALRGLVRRFMSGARGVEGPEAGVRAVKRAAVGGRMTARWSGAVQRGAWCEPAHPRTVSKSNVGGFPTALDGQSPKGMFSRVLVT